MMPSAEPLAIRLQSSIFNHAIKLVESCQGCHEMLRDGVDRKLLMLKIIESHLTLETTSISTNDRAHRRNGKTGLANAGYY